MGQIMLFTQGCLVTCRTRSAHKLLKLLHVCYQVKNALTLFYLFFVITVLTLCKKIV